MSTPKPASNIKIVVKDEMALGTYANFASIVHNFAEFILDFGRMVPGRDHVEVVSRVVMTPVHAKQLLRALTENLSMYERNFGEIPEGPAVSPGAQTM
jgi:hypothetical protein